MSYRAVFAPRADHDFEELPGHIQVRLRPRIDRLASEPRPRRAEKLSGGEGLFRIRVGDYRVVYQVRDTLLIVLVVKIGHRREAYRRR